MAYLKDKVWRLPLPIVPTTLGVLVLSSVYDSLGFPLLHWAAVVLAAIVVVLYALKLACHLRGVVAQEYADPLVAALYPTFPMLIMMLCVFCAQILPALWVPAEVLFFIMFATVCAHMILFFIRFVVRRFEWKTFMPSWYVTTNGIMVSTVAGMPFMPRALAVGVVTWGIIIYVVVTPFMLWRMRHHSVAESSMHAQAIMLQPCSMCLASYTNVFPQPNLIILVFLFVCVAVSLAYVVGKLPKFFSVRFHPGHAGMTFPMVMALLATRGFATALASSGLASAAWAAEQLAGAQLVLATTVTAVVCARFAGKFAAWIKPDRDERPRKETGGAGAGRGDAEAETDRGGDKAGGRGSVALEGGQARPHVPERGSEACDVQALLVQAPESSAPGPQADGPQALAWRAASQRGESKT